jgi:hypothetical protein
MRNSAVGFLFLMGCLCRAGSVGSEAFVLESGPNTLPCNTGFVAIASATCSGTAAIPGTTGTLSYSASGLAGSTYGSLGASAQGSIAPGPTASGTLPNYAYVQATSYFVDSFTFNGTATCAGTPCAAAGSGTVQMEFNITGTGTGSFPNYCMGVVAGNNPGNLPCFYTASAATDSTVIISQPLTITFGQAFTFTVALFDYGYIYDFLDARGGFTAKNNAALIGFLVKDSAGRQLASFTVTSASGTAYSATTVPPTVLSQFAFGAGWYSALYFTNTGSTSVSFSVNFTGDNGSPLMVPSLGGSSTTLNLAPLATAIIEAPNNGSLSQGYASVSLPAGVQGYGVFRYSSPGIPDQEAVVPLSSGFSGTSTLIWDDTNYVTSVAIVNPSPLPTMVNITVWDNNGNLLGTSPVTLPPFTKTENVLHAYPGLAGMAGLRGSAQFSVATGTVSVLGLRSNGPAITSIPAVQQ